MGGTSVEIAIMNLDGVIENKMSIETQRHVGSQLIPLIADTIKSMIKDSQLTYDQIFGVGVGVPGITDVDNGVVIDAPSVGWENVPLRNRLEELLPFPVYLDNDVNIAALGELWKGVGETNSNFLMITLGTGVGCGIIINSQLYRGSSYAAGEIGYMVTDKKTAEKNYEHTFTGYGFLDNHVGGPSITRRMKNYSSEAGNSETWSAKKVFQSAKSGDEIALEALNEPLSHLSFALINAISLLNPERIVLGGRISKSMDQFLPSISATIDKHIPIQTEIETTSVTDVSLLGAGYLLLMEHESILKI
nr:ROK family protein [Oceanobacillus manasiensis]